MAEVLTQTIENLIIAVGDHQVDGRHTASATPPAPTATVAADGCGDRGNRFRSMRIYEGNGNSKWLLQALLVLTGVAALTSVFKRR